MNQNQSCDEFLNSLLDKRTIWFEGGLVYRHGSTHIGDFYGKENSMMDAGEFIWTKNDAPYIHKKIDMLQQCHNFINIEFANYAPNLKGTKTLYAYLQEIFVESREFRMYMLGVILYHQLLYISKLVGNYDTSYPKEYFEYRSKHSK